MVAGMITKHLIGYINAILFTVLAGFYHEHEPRHILLSVTLALNVYHLLIGGYSKKDGKL